MPEISWSVVTGVHNRPTGLVQTKWPEQAVPENLHLWLRTPYGNRIPAQLERLPDGRAVITWVAAAQPPHTSRTYTFSGEFMESADETHLGVAITDHVEAGFVAATACGALQTRYHYRNVVRPYLHPWVGPHGAGLTRNWPMEDGYPGEKHDHPHHKSMLFGAHNNVNGADNWSEEPGHGYKRHLEFTELVSGPVWGRITSLTEVQNAEHSPVMQEALSLTFFPLEQGIMQMDVQLTLHANRGPVLYSGTKEAGLVSVRVASPMEEERLGRIENGYGAIGEKECWGKPAPWCHYSGPLTGPNGEMTVGIGIMDHPQNLRYPTEWHVRAYGLFAANFFGLADYDPQTKRDGSLELAAGEAVSFRYRLVTHPGDARNGQMQERFLEYAYGTRVEAAIK